MALIHKYSCGCVGVPLTSTTCILISACDGDTSDNALCFQIRDFKEEKSSSQVSDNEQKAIVDTLGELVHLGYQMRDLAWTISRINQK